MVAPGGLKGVAPLVAAVLLRAGVARAEEPARVRFHVSCDPQGTDPGEVRRILDAELAPGAVTVLQGRELPLGTDEASVVVDGCTDDPPLATASFERRGQSSTRRIELGDAPPEARSRILALALAEGIIRIYARDSETLPEKTQGAPPAPSGLPQAGPTGSTRTPDQQTPLGPASGAALGVALQGRYATRAHTVLGGADFGVVHPRWALGGTLFGTRRDDALGSASLLVASSLGTVELLRLGVLAVRIRGELGAAIGSGAAAIGASGNTVFAPHTALALGVAGKLPLSDDTRLDVFGGAGLAGSLTVRAGGHDLGSASGPFALVTLGVSFPL